MDKQKESSPISVKKVLATSFFVDVTDVILGIILTIVTGSVVMLSQTLEGIADLLSSALLLFGLEKSKKKADSQHPLGHGREVYFWTLISALIMLSVTSTFTFYFGLERFLNPKNLENTFYAYAVLIFTIITNSYALSLSLRKLKGRRSINKIWQSFLNSSLIETKTAFILDLMGTSASVLGLIALFFYALTNNAQFDGLGAMVIGVIMAVLSIMLLAAIKDFLIGKSVSIQTIDVIKKATGRVKDVISIQDLKATHMGSENIMINLEVNANQNLKTEQLEKLIDDVKQEIIKDLPQASHIQVELESEDKKNK